MYATNRLLGFESLSSSFFGAQAAQVPLKPNPDVQTLLDAAAKLPKADQLAGYEKALDAAIASKDPAGARFAARELRNVLIALKRTSEVEQYLLGLQKRAQQAKFPLMEAHVLVNLALTYVSAKQFDKTIVAYEAAAKLFEAGGDKAGQSRAVGYMASTLSDIGKTAEASVAFDRALPLAKESGDQVQVALLLSLVAGNRKKLGRLDEAITNHEQALALRRMLGLRMEVANSLNSIAIIKYENGDVEDALGLYEEANSIFVQLGDKESSTTVLSNIALIYHDRGEVDKALSLHCQATCKTDPLTT